MHAECSGLQSHRGFYLDFKGKHERPGCVAGSGSLQAVPEMAMCETMRVNPKLQWRPGSWKCQECEHLSEKLPARGGASSGEGSCGLQMPRP
jgi:hypothetical protein